MSTLSRIFLVITICFTSFSWGQELEAVTEILSKVEARYSNSDQYTMEVLYQYFEPSQGEKAVETMEGLIIKDGSNYYSKIHNTETVFINTDYIKINHDEKAVLYGLMDMEQRPSPVELSKLSAYFTSAEVFQKGDIARFELLFKESNMVPYRKMALTVNLKTYEILKQELFLIAGQQMPGGQNPLARTSDGIVSVSFKEIPFSKKDSKRFLISDYIQKGAQVSLSKKLATYSLYQ
ncbi:MAG: hypothetical protein ABJM06_10000 [Gilvibacter sp.]